MPRSYTRLVTTPAAARAVRPVVRPFVSLLTDFGTRDPSVAICHGVVLGICPDAIVVDVSHEVEKFHVRDGALLLWCALPYLPVGAHVAVVDPGVGTERRGVALETGRGDVLIGPDNGLLLPAAQRVGGVVRAHIVENHEYRLPLLSSSFHGRDVFAPAAAHVALGTPIEALGRPISPDGLVALEWPASAVYEGELDTEVLYVDSFENVKLAAEGTDLRAALPDLAWGDRILVGVARGGGETRHELAWAETFGRVPVGQPLLYEDSYGRLCLAVNQGSAARQLGLDEGSRITIRAEPPRVAQAALITRPAMPVVASGAPSAAHREPTREPVPGTVAAVRGPDTIREPAPRAAAVAPRSQVPEPPRPRTDAPPLPAAPVASAAEPPPRVQPRIPWDAPPDAQKPAPAPAPAPATSAPARTERRVGQPPSPSAPRSSPEPPQTRSRDRRKAPVSQPPTAGALPEDLRDLKDEFGI